MAKMAKSHYDDCPYGCNEKGMLLDTESGNLVQCPHCSKKKKELLAMGYVETEEAESVPLSTILGINNPYLTSKFAYESVIPDGERLFLESESMEWQGKVAEELYLGLTIGELPRKSYCFGISVKGRIDRFVYPMVAKGYLGGLSFSKFISCTEFCRMQFNMAEGIDEFYESDLVFMLINDGSNLAELGSAKGLMQSRALRGKPTVFVTTWTIEACSGLLGFSDDEDDSLFLARPVFVKYKKGKNSSHSSYINNLIGVENDRVENSVSMADLI